MCLDEKTDHLCPAKRPFDGPVHYERREYCMNDTAPSPPARDVQGVQEGLAEGTVGERVSTAMAGGPSSLTEPLVSARITRAASDTFAATTLPAATNAPAEATSNSGTINSPAATSTPAKPNTPAETDTPAGTSMSQPAAMHMSMPAVAKVPAAANTPVSPNVYAPPMMSIPPVGNGVPMTAAARATAIPGVMVPAALATPPQTTVGPLRKRPRLRDEPGVGGVGDGSDAGGGAQLGTGLKPEEWVDSPGKDGGGGVGQDRAEGHRNGDSRQRVDRGYVDGGGSAVNVSQGGYESQSVGASPYALQDPGGYGGYGYSYNYGYEGARYGYPVAAYGRVPEQGWGTYAGDATGHYAPRQLDVFQQEPGLYSAPRSRFEEPPQVLTTPQPALLTTPQSARLPQPLQPLQSLQLVQAAQPPHLAQPVPALHPAQLDAPHAGPGPGSGSGSGSGPGPGPGSGAGARAGAGTGSGSQAGLARSPARPLPVAAPGRQGRIGRATRRSAGPAGQTFECPFPACPRVFTRKANLVTHQRIHLPVSDAAALPYGCKECGRRFRWRSSAKSHAGSCTHGMLEAARRKNSAADGLMRISLEGTGE